MNARDDAMEGTAAPRTGLTRRTALAGLAAAGTAAVARAAPALAAPVVANGTTFTVSVWGGVTEDTIRKHVQPEFERMTGAKVAYDLGGQGARVNKLLAQRGTPSADVIFTSDEAVITGFEAGVLMPARRKNLSNLADIYDWAFTVKGYDTAEAVPGTPFTCIAMAIAYNPDKVKKAPASLEDLFDPALKGHMTAGTPAGSTTPAVVIELAEDNGGSATDLDPGIRKLAELRPFKLTTFWTDWAPQFKTGEVVMALELDYYLETMKAQGYPLEYAFPGEGAPGLSEYVSMVKGTPNPDLAELFQDMMMSRAVQEAFAVESYSGSVNSKLTLTPAVAARCMCGERTKSLRFFDPKVTSDMRPALVERLNTEVLPEWNLR